MTQTPKAKNEDLVVEEVDDETIIYNQSTHEAHSLNGFSNVVWRLCDGVRSVDEIADYLIRQGVDRRSVLFALERLSKAGLLEVPFKAPVETFKATSRRELLKTATATSALGVAVPVISSITVPTAAQAMSGCTGSNQPCGSGEPACCAGLLCVDVNIDLPLVPPLFLCVGI